MKIKKGDWYKRKITCQGLKEGNLYIIINDRGQFFDDDGDYRDMNSINIHFTKLHTIQDLKDGKVAVVNDGTVEELETVMIYAFPMDANVSGTREFYRAGHGGNTWDIGRGNLPTQSVKNFLVQLPKEEKQDPFKELKDQINNQSAKVTVNCFDSATIPPFRVSGGRVIAGEMNKARLNDPINPDHYKSYSVETIDMMVAIYGKEKVAIHCELTAFKYRQRLGKKDSLEQDLAKEKWYLEKAKELRNDNSVTKV